MSHRNMNNRLSKVHQRLNDIQNEIKDIMNDGEGVNMLGSMTSMDAPSTQADTRLNVNIQTSATSPNKSPLRNGKITI